MAGGLSARPRRLRAGLGLAALAGALVIAGCSGSGSGEGNATSATVASSPTTVTASPAETTTTASPTETSALPPLPEAAKENTPEGAEAFIRYYFDVANLAHTKPETGLVPQLAHTECQSCVDMEQQVGSLAESNQRASSSPYAIKSMERVGGSTGDVTLFNMVVTLPATSVEGADGTPGESSVAADYSGTGAAIWVENRWQLFGLELQPS